MQPAQKSHPTRPQGSLNRRRSLALRRGFRRTENEASGSGASWRAWGGAGEMMPFSAAWLELADGALKYRNLRHRIAGLLQLVADLFFEVGGVADLFDEQF